MNGQILNAFLLKKLEIKQVYSISLVLFNIILEILAKIQRQLKEKITNAENMQFIVILL